MSSSVFRLGIKFRCSIGREVPLVDFIPVFHRWIQTNAVAGMLIDVADYSHVPEGPGVILVSNEGIYSIDETHGVRGLAYAQRRPFDGSVAQCLAMVVGCAAKASLLLEGEFAGTLAFRGDEVEVFANDRLLAPNTPATLEALRPHLDALARRLYPGREFRLTHEPDPRERFAVVIRASGDAAFADVAARATL